MHCLTASQYRKQKSVAYRSFLPDIVRASVRSAIYEQNRTVFSSPKADTL
jgi:hypothetical protein